MKVLFVRHGPAGDPAAYARTGKPDSSRALTPAGRRKMKKAARGLRRVLPSIGVILTSPLKRAAQTAEILAKAYAGAGIVAIPELKPGGLCDALLRRIKASPRENPIALVGHEPHLSATVSYLVAGDPRLRVELKKGAACLLEFVGPPRPGGATLLWSLAPAHLRKLGG